MTDKKPLAFCVDWMRGRAERTPMPASRATMESIVAYLEELESLRTPNPQADRPRTNGDVIRAMSDEGLACIIARGDWLCDMDEACYGLTKVGCRKHALAWLKREAP